MHHPGGARASVLLVDAQPLGQRLPVRPHDAGQHGGVFDRHCRALGHVGQGRVYGVTEHRDALGAPALDRRPVVQRPAEALVLVHGIHHRPDHRVPALVVSVQLGPWPAGVPGFVLLRTRHAANEIQQRRAAQVVHHRMVVRAAPDGRHQVGAQRRRNPLDRHGAAPGDLASKSRLIGADDELPDRGTYAIGANHQIGMHRVAPGDVDRGARYALSQVRDACPQRDRVRRHCRQRIDQHRMQIATVNLVVRRAMLLLVRRAQRNAVQQLAAVMATELKAVRLHGHRLQARPQTQREQHLDGVGAHLHAGTDFAQRRCLLQHLHRMALAGEQRRGCQATDSSADDGDLHAIANITAAPSLLAC